MNEAQLSDLKQFIAVTVSQATADMATKTDLHELEIKLKAELGTKIDDLDLKIDTISETLNEKVDLISETLGGRLNDHEIRLTKLEQQTL